MEDTCRGCTCWLYLMMKDLRGGGLDFNDCPFYVEMVWTPDPVGGKVQTAKVIKDCTNKRSLQWMLENVHPRLVGLQQASEQARNKSDELCGIFIRGFNRIQENVRIEEKRDEKTLLSQ